MVLLPQRQIETHASKNMLRHSIATAVALLLVATAAHGQAEDRAFCPARPGKASPTCTITPGRLQIELDAFDQTIDRSNGVKSTDAIMAVPQLRVGLSTNSELQLAWTPHERFTTAGLGKSKVNSGIGDMVAGLKYNLTDNRDGFGAALQPFVKIPTATRSLGNGKVEGGLVAPLSVPLSKGWALNLSPEIDVSANDDGGGYHTAGALAAGLGCAFTPELSFGAEIWVERAFVSEAETAATVDLMLAFTPADIHDLQFDAGVNRGITPAAPNTQVYLGVAKRF